MEREREREKKEKNDRFESLIKSPGSRSSGTPIKSTPCGTKLSRFYISCVECIDIESINRYSRNPRVARRRFEKVATRNISIQGESSNFRFLFPFECGKKYIVEIVQIRFEMTISGDNLVQWSFFYINIYVFVVL